MSVVVDASVLVAAAIVLVVFCRDTVARATAELFLPLADLFRGKTASLIVPATMFAST